MRPQPLFINGDWHTPANGTETLQARSPHDAGVFPETFPVSAWAQLESMLDAGERAARQCFQSPPDLIADFLDAYAEGIERAFDALAEIASLETGLPISARLIESELPRTVLQLRQAACAAREESWRLATIDTQAGLRSCLESLGKPVLIIGPNNFPFAYNAIAGGDFAAALAAGNPVIAKAHPAHPGTTLALARICAKALQRSKLPPATVQMFYHCDPDDGLRLAGDPRLGALAFTGSRPVGRQLKAAADAVGTPVYLELGSINPVFMLPGALSERPDKLRDAFTGSCLLGNGQFCTNPGLVLLIESEAADSFIESVAAVFRNTRSGPMLLDGMQTRVDEAAAQMLNAGAHRLAQGTCTEGAFGVTPELLRVSGEDFLHHPETFQEEMFGPVSLLVVAKDADALVAIADELGANLTASIFSASNHADDPLYARLAPRLQVKVGRFLNDKMPTGVTVSPAMMHGGPFPAGSHPGFTAVGAPATLRRFGALHCYDHVRPHRLPPVLRNKNVTPETWRLIDGQWTQADLSGT